MRINRSVQLYPENASVHMFWRCHNREFYLESENIKNLYFECINDALNYKDQGENCKIHTYCGMSNHFHLLPSYKNGSNSLSNFMRYCGGLFGGRFNRRNKRSGKVAEGRPKTPLIQNSNHEMRVHFYIEANPIRAKFRTIENLKDYHACSYGFYAYGKKSKYSHLLTPPTWYLSLGNTPGERRRKYRKLFRDYIEKYQSEYSSIFFKAYIGDSPWVTESTKKAKCNPSLHLVEEIDSEENTFKDSLDTT